LGKEKAKTEVSNKERLENLQSQYKDVVAKRSEAQAQLNDLTTIALKLQGAIELLESIENLEKGEKE
jgi:hypothetical protein